MIKKFLFILCCIFTFSISTCSAEKFLSSDSAAIGGITTGSSGEYVKSIYGDPNKIRVSENSQGVVTWYYGDTFQIDFTNGLASAVVSSGNNGLATPDGISVGMKKSKITSKYGRPQESDKYGTRAIYTYKTDNGTNVTFIVNGDLIKEIRIS